MKLISRNEFPCCKICDVYYIPKKNLDQRFRSVDFDSAKADVSPFLSQTEKEGLEFWSADFFIDITEPYLH